MRILLLSVALILAAAGCGPKTSSMADLEMKMVKLPNGKQIRAEVALNAFDMQRGLMYRDALPSDRGMIFVHDKPGTYTYWMYQVRFPIDIIWMNRDRRVVEISANTPPCTSKASECPSYGGHTVSQFVLELAAGEAARNGINVGDTLAF